MTEEVTDAMLSAGANASTVLFGTDDWEESELRAIYLAMEAARVPASNSPTTNGEVSGETL